MKRIIFTKENVNDRAITKLPECGSAYAYEDRGLFICPECGHEWSPTEEVAEEGLVVKDSNGNL